jgi:hypothetical protein
LMGQRHGLVLAAGQTNEEHRRSLGKSGKPVVVAGRHDARVPNQRGRLKIP